MIYIVDENFNRICEMKNYNTYSIGKKINVKGTVRSILDIRVHHNGKDIFVNIITILN